jgi:hypothetical protein
MTGQAEAIKWTRRRVLWLTLLVLGIQIVWLLFHDFLVPRDEVVLANVGFFLLVAVLYHRDRKASGSREGY